jgi:prefoldin subunit 5
MDSYNSDVNVLKQVVQLLHSEMKLLQTEIKYLKAQQCKSIDELKEKIDTDIQEVKNDFDGKLEMVCSLIDDVNARCDTIERI